MKELDGESIRGTRYITSNKLLDLFKIKLLSDKKVQFEKYSCEFDFANKKVIIHNDQESVEGIIKCKKRKISSISYISVNDHEIYLNKFKRFSLFPERSIKIVGKIQSVDHYFSTLTMDLEIEDIASLHVDYVYRFIECKASKDFLILAIVLASYFYLFHVEFDVSSPA